MTRSLKHFIKLLLPQYQKLILEYKVNAKPRYGHGLPPHPRLYEIISKNKDVYAQFLSEIMTYQDVFQKIKLHKDEKNNNEPTWNNGFLPGLDIMVLYTMLCHFKPRKYIEIGSGNSTKVARKAIAENKLNTHIISIDPFPRAEVAHLTDKSIKTPIEEIDDYYSVIIDELQENDILFIDNSHLSAPNSDVTICFLDIFPYLKKGVIVHFHDIYLPYDYPPFMCDRFYNEQYLLAAFLLANPDRYKILMPNFFISEDKNLSGIVSSIWTHPILSQVEKHGGSFWLQIK